MSDADTQQSNPDPLLKHAKAAEYLSVSTRFLSSLVADGDVRPTRMGRSVRYRVSELERYLSTATESR